MRSSIILRAAVLAAGLAVPALTAQGATPVPTGEIPTGSQKQKGSVPNAIFKHTQLDLGTFLEGEVAKGRFPMENTRDETVEFSGFQKSCTCSSARIKIGDAVFELRDEPSENTIYKVVGEGDEATTEIVNSIPLEAGQTGVIEVETDLKNVTGRKGASLTLRSTDARLPIISLNWTAQSLQYFQLVPNEVNLNKMKWSDTREFTVRVSSRIEPDFEITGHGPLPEQMKIEYEKIEIADEPVWEIRGTYGPNVPADTAGGMIRFNTDLQGKTFPLRIIAWVEGPLEVKPGGFLQIGMIKSKDGGKKSIEFNARDGFALEVTGIEVKESSIGEFLEITSRKDEDGTVFVDVAIKPGAPRRLAHGSFEVKLNHPVIKSKTFQFNGFVR